MTTATDYTPTGLKIEGAYENDRNGENSKLYKAIVREAFDVEDVICGHHMVYEKQDKRADGFTYQVIEEIPSADALIFNHNIAVKIWGQNFKETLAKLACEPVETRDKLLGDLYYSRIK